ncbi:hypothetical protein HMI55_002231 [Coelomomyces lativittatus]|nr:hypothetical protein HMI56_003203 [Coelomomyces lativittatus]KAJ1503969.1 hypothetical protein HMI55_002231 [Coelomomyces lativittatus]
MVKVAPFIEDMKGEDSEIEAFVVDILPSTPPPPVVTYQVNGQNSKIILKLFENMTASGGTPTYVHRLYHAANNRSEFHLLTELEPENMEYVMHHPELAVLHYFRVTSVNQLGESDPSEIAGPCIIDFPPSRPSPPIVKRDSIQSVLLKINPPASIGESPVTKYLIVGHLNNSPDPLFSLEVSKLSIILEDLSLGTEYVFAVSAMNSAGWSPQSRFSEVICLEKLLPIPPSPQCIILSPTTVRCLLYTSMENEVCPPCTGYKLWLSRTSDLSDNETVCPFLPTQKDMPSVYLLENLEIGGNYWVSVSLIGVSQESALSPPVYLCLAAAIPLPSTPSSPPSSAVTTPKPTNLLRATSRSIELTVSQRIQNMFKGNPAFAIPDDVKAQADADGVKLLVKTSSKSYESLNNSCKREQSSQQSFYHEKSPPVQHNPIEKRTSYSGKKIKDPIKSKTGLNEKK